jgi:hypothetical protein
MPEDDLIQVGRTPSHILLARLVIVVVIDLLANSTWEAARSGANAMIPEEIIRTDKKYFIMDLP